jgi:hypothetical protein
MLEKKISDNPPIMDTTFINLSNRMLSSFETQNIGINRSIDYELIDLSGNDFLYLPAEIS